MTWEHGGRRSPHGLRTIRHEWMNRAACTGEDVEEFFDQSRHARSICERCPVITACADYAWENGIEYGMFGGVTAQQRVAGIRYMPKERLW